MCIICCWVWGYFWTVIPKFPRLTLYKHNSREQGWLIINIMKATCFKSETTVSNDFPPLFVTVFCGIFYPFISIPVSFGTYRSLSYKLVSVSAILSCRPFFILIFLPCIKMNHYGFSRKSIWKNLETFPWSIESRLQLFFSRCLPWSAYHSWRYEFLDVQTGL